MSEIDPDREWLARLAQEGARMKLSVRQVPGSTSSSTDVYLHHRPEFVRPDGQPWYVRRTKARKTRRPRRRAG